MCKNSGFRSRIQKSYNIFGIHSKFIPPMIPWAYTDRTDLTGFLCGWEISRMLYGLWFFVGSHGSHRSHPFFCGWEISRRLYGLWFFVGSHGFREIQQEDYLWEFVLIRGRKKHLFNPLKIH